jgi:hypothetical protein
MSSSGAVFGAKSTPLDRPNLEPRAAAGLEQHHRADREGAGDAHEEGLDVLVVPDPSALEVWQLELPLHDLGQKVAQEGLGRIERGHGHRLRWVFPVYRIDVRGKRTGAGVSARSALATSGF